MRGLIRLKPFVLFANSKLHEINELHSYFGHVGKYELQKQLLM